ncbi:hypothetical protein D9M70_337540 [compost metagenome]
MQVLAQLRIGGPGQGVLVVPDMTPLGTDVAIAQDVAATRRGNQIAFRVDDQGQAVGAGLEVADEGVERLERDIGRHHSGEFAVTRAHAARPGGDQIEGVEVDIDRCPGVVGAFLSRQVPGAGARVE